MIGIAAAVALLAAGASAQVNSLCPSGLNCIPGVVIVQNGIDIVKGTQNGTKEDPQHEYLLPVYEMTYEKGYTYTNEAGTTWNVPDQIQAYSNPKLVAVANSAFVETYEQWITTKMSTFSFGIGVQGCFNGSACLGLNFNYSHESYKYKNNLAAGTKQASFSEMQWTHYSLQELMPPFLMPVYSGLKGFLASLPDKIATPKDQSMYSELIRYWGTHIAMGADMGAYAHVSSFASNSYVQSVTQQWAANQWGLNFDAQLFNLLNITGHAGGFHNKSSIHVNQSFIANTNSYNFYRGGDTSIANETQVKWLETTVARPAWVTTRLASLSDVVSPTRTAVANNIDATIKYYITKGTLPTDPVAPSDTYPRPVEFYTANWPAFFLAGGRLPPSHREALAAAGRL